MLQEPQKRYLPSNCR